MSYQFSPMDHDNSSSTFATLDVAFNKSLPMHEFQKKMVSKNPLMSQTFENDEPVSALSHLSEEKMNDDVDSAINSFYNGCGTAKVIEEAPINSPNYMENFGPTYVWDKNNQTLYKVNETNGMNIIKIILIVIIVVLLVYGGYKLYTNKKMKNEFI
ncbi:MAG: hypothetical protein Satyrvirus20_8 [Satyrvirus sp.]|uniref:Uncharacterized protein n=1 Tax=Satyrvirus sp. TaxID=2487771 RepID=A0A3G5AGS4_9VIRU|nr:MAG: hypothetical protein Satyrvirus20_8 [Satyrvirus sp.]